MRMRPTSPWRRRRRRHRHSPRTRSPSARPRLRWTPTAWAKLLYLRDLGPTEVGGFGISAAHDPLLIEEFVLVRQRCTALSVQFDDAAVADYFDDQVDRGRAPERCGRIWIHTHPGDSAEPSAVDEETFARSFGAPDWAVMAIVARGGATYARVRFNTGPGGQLRLATGVDYRPPFPAADPDLWREEYARHVQVETLELLVPPAVAPAPQRSHPLERLTAALASDPSDRSLDLEVWDAG